MLRLLDVWQKRRANDEEKKIFKEYKAENSRLVMVRDLPQSASEKDIEHYFGLYGTVLQVQNLSMDIDEERISVVKFNDPVDTRRLVELSKTMSGLKIHDKRIKLEILKDNNEDVIALKNPVNERNINDYLHDSCLNEIFSLLPLESLASVSLVCKRWQYVAEKTVKKDLEVDHFCALPTIDSSYRLLSVFGERLTTLRLTLSDFTYTKKILITVQKNCQNLKYFSLMCENATQIYQTTLTEYKKDCKDADKILSMLLRHLQHLESLKLADLYMISDKSLTNLQETLHSLHLENCIMLRGKEIGCNVKNVHKLTFKKNTSMTDEEIGKLIKRTPLLVDITLSGCFPSINGNIFHQVANMGKQLRHIDLSFNSSLSVPYLVKILQKCHNLESVNVSGFNILNYNGGILLMETLGSMKNLKKVIMNALTIPEDIFQALPPCPNLREIECRANPNFTNESFSHIIAMCDNLNIFDVRENFCLTKYCLLTFNKYPRTQPLKIIFGGTQTFDIQPSLTFQNVEYVKRSKCEIREIFSK